MLAYTFLQNKSILKIELYHRRICTNWQTINISRFCLYPYMEIPYSEQRHSHPNPSICAAFVLFSAAIYNLSGLPKPDRINRKYKQTLTLAGALEFFKLPNKTTITMADTRFQCTGWNKKKISNNSTSCPNQRNHVWDVKRTVALVQNTMCKKRNSPFHWLQIPRFCNSLKVCVINCAYMIRPSHKACSTPEQ